MSQEGVPPSMDLGSMLYYINLLCIPHSLDCELPKGRDYVTFSCVMLINIAGLRRLLFYP
jgi:hypothetical protein